MVGRDGRRTGGLHGTDKFLGDEGAEAKSLPSAVATVERLRLELLPELILRPGR